MWYIYCGKKYICVLKQRQQQRRMTDGFFCVFYSSPKKSKKMKIIKKIFFPTRNQYFSMFKEICRKRYATEPKIKLLEQSGIQLGIITLKF
jgi:hypothetical protein